MTPKVHLNRHKSWMLPNVKKRWLLYASDGYDHSGGNSDIVQPWLNGSTPKMNQVVGGNLDCQYRFGFWQYAQGGYPKRRPPWNIAPQYGTGQTVSTPPK